MRKFPRVSIAVCALNEEENIGKFLHSILKQKEAGYVLDKIIIYSDGSTDNTAKVVRSFKKTNQKIVLKNYKTRAGKSLRLNDIYKNLKSDILVQSDADVVFSHPYVIRDIIKPLINEKKVYMCGGHPQPVKAVTFTEKAINCTFEAYSPLRKILRGGNNVFSVDGRLLAYKKKLVKKINIPHDMTANDAFTYFCCLSLNYQYRYVSSAVVWFRSPQSIKDQVKQNTRFVFAPARMSRHFDKDLVKREYFIPKGLITKLMFKQFIKHPILCSYIYLLNLYCKIKAKRAINYYNAKWPMAETTKSLN